MSQNQLSEHKNYLADVRKWQAYRDALDEVVEAGDVVLDLGTGSGMLGYLACDAGAGSVVAVDSGDIIGLARRIAEQNGYGERIRHVKKLSTQLKLDPLADVVVSDQIGGLVHDAGILGYYADARRRLLAPQGRLVPASFRLLLAPVTFNQVRESIEFWSSVPEGLDVGSARSHSVNTEWRLMVKPDELVRLSPGQQLAAIDSDNDDPIRGNAEFLVQTPGRLDGFIGWFVAQMSPSVTMTNDPFAADRFERWCNFLPLDTAVDVELGDTVTLGLDIRPRVGVTSWSSKVARGGQQMQSAKQSTFDGAFLTGESLGARGKNRPVEGSERVSLARAVLDLVDGTRSRADIARSLEHHIGSAVVSSDHLDRFVKKVLGAAR